MATIKEDYVSFERTKLLKEKAFNDDKLRLYQKLSACQLFK